MFGKKSTALVVIDMQKGLFSKKTKVFRENELIGNINSLIDTFHEQAMKVFFVRHTNSSVLVENSDDWQIHPGLHVQDCDMVLNKEHSSAFKEMTLKNELDKAGITHIIVAGLVTHGCVKAACQDGMKLGYDVALVSDGHSSFNRDAAELIDEWNGKLGREGICVVKTCDMLGQLPNAKVE